MTTASNGWMSEQRSLLGCTTNSSTEAAITSGVADNGGTYAYNRTGINIANGLTGAVVFNLKAWRTFGGTGCNADYNKVNNNSWKITVTLAPILANNEVATQKIKVYPIPFTDSIHIDTAQEVKTIVVTDTTGKVVRTLQQPQHDVYLGDLNSGIYILTMTMEDDTVQHTKVIKQ